MYKKNAIVVAVILAIVAVAIVALVTSVFVDNSEERYGQVTVPQTALVTEKSHSEMTAPVEQESEAAEVQEDVSEAVSEPEADVQVDKPEAVVEEVAQADTAAASKETAPATPAQDEPATEAEGGEFHVVTAQGLKYNPLVVKIQPGDTVAWENMSTHDTQSLEGLIPEGAEPWHSPMSENFQRTFTVEGIYVYKCTPHFGAGMGGAIIVGKPVNLDAIKAVEVKGAARRLVKKAIAAAEQM